MNTKKRLLMSSLALALTSSLYAKTYNVQSSTLQEAIIKISKTAQMPYLVDTNILKGKKANPVKDIEGLENALKTLLKGTTGLEAVIENNMIMVREKTLSYTQNNDNLGEIDIIARPLNETFEVNVGAFGSKDTMEIPIMIQSYDSQIINKISSQTAIDILKLDPSIQSASYGGSFDNFVLRGFPMDFFNTIRKDGLSLSPHQDYSLELVEKVDVLKGPSGFIYGFNSPGGSINYISKRPTKETLLNISTRFSTLEDKYISIDNSKSFFNEKIAYRLNAGYEKKGNFGHANNFERKFVGIATDFKLSEKALLQINADYSNKISTTDPLLRADQSSRVDKLNPDTYILPPKVDRHDLLSPSWYRYETIANNIDTKLEYRFNQNWIWITQAGYSLVKRDGGFNDLFDIKPNGEIGYADYYNARGSKYKTYQGKTYLSGKFDTKKVFHDFFIGASYKRYKDRTHEWDFVESTDSIRVSEVSVGNVLNPINPKVWDFGDERPIGSNAGTKETSLFVSDLIYLNDNFQVLAGGRFVNFKTTDPGYNLKPQDKKVIVPSTALIYRPNENLMTYISYSEGLEKGDYAPAFANNSLEPTNAIESKQYEIGIKSNLTENTFLTLAAFDIRRGASYLNLNNDYVSDGEFNHKGIEFSTITKPFSDLSLRGNIAYLNTKLKGVEDKTTLNKKSEGVPKFKASLFAEYKISNDLSIDAIINYVGERPVDAQNSGFMPSYTTIDGGITYKTKIDKKDLILRLYGNNLTNKYYYSSVIYQGGLAVGKPREVFLSATMRF